MSINSAMLAGVSGLAANSAALAAVSQNIANVNTVGYKRSQGEFQTLVNSQTRSAGSYAAGGVMASTRQFVSQEGQLLRTGESTDLAIAGQGFFVTTEKAENIMPTDSRLFTRAGAFRLDKNGYLQNSAGLYLQGWPADANGDVSIDPSDLTRLRSINIGTVGGTAEQTTRAQVNANLNSAQTVSQAAQLAVSDPANALAYDPATNSMAMFDPTATPQVGVEPDFKLNVPVSDSKGGQRNIELRFLKSDEPNVWHVEIVAPPTANGATVETDPVNAHGLIQSGKIAFTTNGRLDTALMGAGAPAGGGNWLFPDPTDTNLVFGASDAAAPAGGVKWAEDLGISTQTINLDFNASAGGISQMNAASYVDSIVTNGTAFGNLDQIAIDENGYVTAIFDNGATRRIAQVAVATFTSPDSLQAVSGNAYRVSLDSGTFNLKAAGTGGAGLIAAQQLESSTVDLSAEFTSLITTQRAYSASSKIITTADEMLAELINIKR
jgi:flagellar hook protein FlgE